MLHLGQTIDPGKDYVPVFAESSELKENDFHGHVIYENPQGEGRILIMRDSYGTAMHLPLSQSWASYDAIHVSSFDWSMVEEYKPDVFVIETVERKLGNLAKIKLPD